MSDFLTNLAARTIAAPTLRPRLRMRFEPAIDPPPALAREDVSPPAAAADGAEPPPAAPEHTRVARRAAEIARPERPLRVAPIEPPAVPHVESVEVKPSASPTTTAEAPRPVGIVRRSAVHVATPRTIEQTALPAPPDTASETSPALRHRVEPSSQPGEPTRAVARPSATTVESSLDAPRVEKPIVPHRYDHQEPAVAVRRPTALGKDDSIDRRAVSPVDTRARAAATAATPASPFEPVIHVSIGRVDVRAVVGPAAPRAAKPRSSPMTIDEYMARQKDRR
jgi:hypothetical protein